MKIKLITKLAKAIEIVVVRDVGDDDNNFDNKVKLLLLCKDIDDEDNGSVNDIDIDSDDDSSG